MNQDLARRCFEAALAYVSQHKAEELELVRSIGDALWDRMTCSDFLAEYCWVVNAAGFRVSVVESKFPALQAAFCDFDVDAICQLESLEPALAVIGNRRKAEGFVEGCRQIKSEGFEAFKARATQEGIDALEELPGIGPITKKHLARNTGFANVSKDDVWLVRLAEVLDAASVEQLTTFLAKEFGERQGTVDLVVWRFCADGAWDKWRRAAPIR